MSITRRALPDFGPVERRSSAFALAALALAAVAAACSAGSDASCGEGRVACAGSCVDTSADPAHCGACGDACAAGQSCSQGACADACAVGETACGGACVDTKADAAHCGSCGNACPADRRCVAGACACDGALSSCDGESGPICVDTSADPAHCGACGNACLGDQLCGDGACFCPNDFVECGGSCVDPRTNQQHCGATEGCGAQGGTAGTACAQGWYCTSAACRSCRTWAVAGAFGTVPSSRLVLADLTGDGVLDLVVGGGAEAAVFRGVGDGSFQAIQLLEVSYGWPSVADVDGDGIPDLVLTSGTQLSVFHGYGDGTFPLQPQVLSGPSGDNLFGPSVLADLDGDGRTDIVASGAQGAYLWLQTPHGAGTPPAFAPLVAYPTAVNNQSVTVADVNGDGKLDLVTTDNTTDYETVFVGNAGVLLGQGDGTFQPYVPHPTSAFSNDGVVSDVDLDGAPDIVTASPSEGRADLLRGHGDGTFDAPIAIATGDLTSTILVADATQDGVPDLAFVTAEALKVRTGGGGGQFLPTKSIQVQAPAIALAEGDVDGDGAIDFVVLSGNPQDPATVTVLLGTLEPECH